MRENRQGRPFVVQWIAVILIALCTLMLPHTARAAAAYVQGNSSTASSGSSTNVAFPSAQTAGDLNVVFVGWDQATGSVQSITDSAGNTYLTAIGPSVNPSGATQVVFYAKNIVPGANTVTVRLSGSVSYPDVRILEFTGLATDNPLDVTSVAYGNGATLNSGPLTTTASNDLLVAGGYVQYHATGSGPGYTNILDSSFDVVEDLVLTSTGTYSATSADASGYWLMQQVAFRAANTTLDVIPPTAPLGLNATAVSSGQINLTWSASSDAYGVTGYLIERCSNTGCVNFAQIGSASTTSYQDTGLNPSTSYTYRVRASDGAGNLSGYSRTAGDMTLVRYPSYVQGSSGTPGGAASVSVTFPSVQVAGDVNVVFVGWDQATANVQSITDTVGNTYVVAVGPTVNPSGATQLVYYANNIAAAAAGANTVTVVLSGYVSYPDVRVLEFNGIDVTNPLDGGVSAYGTGTTLSSGPLTTSAPIDLLVASGNVQHSFTGGAGAGYTQILTSEWNIVEDAVATSVGSYTATSSDSSGYWVMQQVALRALAGNPGSPSVPGALTANPVSDTQVNLQWAASTDSFGVSAYSVERCQGSGCANFTTVATVSAPSYSDTGLVPSTSYSYRLRARNVLGNFSGYSGTAVAATLADTTPPSVPTQLTVAALSDTQINLMWTASTDDVGVAGYVLQVCQGSNCTDFTRIGTSGGGSFSVPGLVAGTNYTFRVVASDAAGNVSGYSVPISVTTPAAGASCN